jgi:pimeloyl-ACP methyl ester carboxylesterase
MGSCKPDERLFVFVHGPKSDSWYWHRVIPLIVEAGFEAVAVDLPVEDPDKGLDGYAAAVVSAAQGHPRLTLVTHSMAAFIAPMVADLLRVELIVLVAPMVPTCGESVLQWMDNTRQREAAQRLALDQGREPRFSVPGIYLHDVPDDVAEEFPRHTRGQAMKPFEEPWPLACWPRTPTRCIVGRHDRLFPYEFQCEVVRERLGIAPHAIDGGHLCALSAPDELARQILRPAGPPDEWPAPAPEHSAIARLRKG